MLQLAELRSITDRFSESRWMNEEMFILMAVHIGHPERKKMDKSRQKNIP